MTEALIEAALLSALTAALPTARIIRENRDGVPAKPWIAAEVVRVSRLDDTLVGSFPRARGFLQATVVTEAGLGTSDALTLATTIATAFPMGKRMTITGGVVIIWKPPFIDQGFRDGPTWRLPVRIDYEAMPQ